jgi:hypothetical protein
MNNKILSLKRQLASLDHICTGTLVRRSLICGKNNCRCKAKPAALHGPYYYWSRRLGGRLVSRVVSPSQAKIIGKAIRNYRHALQILRKWEAQTVSVLARQKAAGNS